MAFQTQDVRRKTFAILKILSDSPEAIGARLIARRLKEHGIALGERAVRYHLKLLDARGLTQLVGKDGRQITERGVEELGNALVREKVGLAISRIELLAFRTTFDWEKRSGNVPVNVAFFPKERFGRAVREMRPVFEAGLCVSDLVGVVREGELIGDYIVPRGRIGLVTVCSVLINGVLLKAGVPVDSKFGGILQISEGKPLRFVELIHYAGSSLDPSEVFIRSRMTSVMDVVEQGEGNILANYREIPAACRTLAEEVIARLKIAGIGGVLVMGNTSEPVCEIPVELDRIGLVLGSGLNPVAAAGETGLEAESHAMTAVMDYGKLTKFGEL
ncbi:MAG: DUF128 domain-containing protein [Chloroflexi bacterium]|nr:DUF128 domain-containing protein [Chloroflexota bacterium]